MSNFFSEYSNINSVNSILIVLPGLQGGGMKRHAIEMAKEWVKQGYMVVLLEAYGRIINLTFALNEVRKNIEFILNGNEERFINLLKKINVRVIHYHHFLYTPTFIFNLPKVLSIPYFVTIHDYFSICPIQFLTSKDGFYCCEPGVDQCNVCLKDQVNVYCNNLPEWASQKIPIDISKWRAIWHNFLKNAKTLIVPNEDVSNRLKKYYPDLHFKIFENPEIIFPSTLDGELNHEDKANGNRLRTIKIGVLGRLNFSKGAGLLINCAKYAYLHDLPIEFILFGTIDINATITENISVLGPYEETKVYKLIANQNINFFWFPALIPETYSYTLSIPIRLGIPVFSTDLGAIATRIVKNGWGRTYPYNLAPDELCKELLNFNYSFFENHKERFKLKNTTFPKAVDLYSSNFLDNDRGIDWLSVQNSFDLLAKTATWFQLNNISNIEFKRLLKMHSGVVWKLKQILHLNKKNIYAFLRNNINIGLIYKVYKILFD